MLKQILHNDWTVLPVGDLAEVPAGLRDVSVPARVPGCMHTDLMRVGKIDDPYRDFNEHTLQWIGLTDWQYRTTFDADAKLFDHERIDLVCEGLDTVAIVELNGTALECMGETPMLRKKRLENMHRGYRFDVRPMLKRGRNELVITFASPVKYAMAMRERLGPLPYVNGVGGPFNFIRKMACNFGWDWGPALPTCGIWKGVRLEGWTGVRIRQLRFSTTELKQLTLASNVRLSLQVDLEKSGAHRDELTFGLEGPGQTFSGVSEDIVSDFNLELNGIRPWWPK